MSDIGALEGGGVLDEDDLIQLGLLDGLRNYKVIYGGKSYLVDTSKDGDSFALKYTELFGEERAMSAKCDTQTGKLSDLVNCDASDLRAFVNGVALS
jgi:hypothetical protein